MTLDQVDPGRLEGLVELLGDIRHDLGKYIGFETRFVGDGASDDDLRSALRADLLATRRHGDQTESAWDLWARLRPGGLDDDPDVARIDVALEDLRRVDLDGPRADLLRAADLARVVATATRSLAGRGRARLDDGLDTL